MLKVKISKPIRHLVNGLSEIAIEGESYYHLYSNMSNLFPDLRQCNYDINMKKDKTFEFWFVVNGENLPLEAVHFQPKKDAEIVLVPMLKGGGPLLGPVGLVLFVAMIALTVVVSLLTPRPSQEKNDEANDDPSRANNNSFSELRNSTSTRNSVPLIFGCTRVPGQFIGGRIRTINHDINTVISVANYV